MGSTGICRLGSAARSLPRATSAPARSLSGIERSRFVTLPYRSGGGVRPYAVFGSPARIDGALPCREFPLVWDKGVVGMGDVAFPWGRSYELIYVAGDGWSGARTSSVLRVVHASNQASKEGHPSPKPVALMGALIRNAPPGVIADPFAGSGSSPVAAKHENRRAIGVELDERYCEIAAKRLAQDTLFGGVA